MNLYLLTRTDVAEYDEVRKFVIAANSGDEARKVAQENGSDETRNFTVEPFGDIPFWTNPRVVSCNLIAQECAYLSPSVVCRDFKAG